MSRNAADAPSSAPGNPTDEQHRRSSRRTHSSSPPRRTLPSDPHALPGASSSSHIASHHSQSASSSHLDTPAATAPASDPESSSRRRKRERSSPSGSSSQGDMADTEMEGGASKPSPSESAPEGPPAKKKRTRTLTTPHQAAVLHALLAQSRFPTTQMREEVGRSIGLSARKVQNQRQKARRPRGQASTTSAPLTRPPQFGPFTNAPPGTSSDLSPTTVTGHPGTSAEGFYSRGPGGVGEMAYGGASAPSSASSERSRAPVIPGSSRRPAFDDPAWRTRPPPLSSSRPSTSAAARELPELSTAGEQGPELTLTLPPVMTNDPCRSPISPLSAGVYPSLASPKRARGRHVRSTPPYFDESRRTLPQPNPQPQWDDPPSRRFSRRRSPPAPARYCAAIRELPDQSQPPFRQESLRASLASSPAACGPTNAQPGFSCPTHALDPVRSTAGRAPPEPPCTNPDFTTTSPTNRLPASQTLLLITRC
ncbi:hypothetical protein C8T65DRAFT_709704 [Cerioporus squamosus]|nr:hypothetical protein C8T65DRAFT_709704 [Cerioporus squamosus]